MKRCTTCQEEVADRFSFCPVCGTTLSVVAPATPVAADAATPRLEGRATTSTRLSDTFQGRAEELAAAVTPAPPDVPQATPETWARPASSRVSETVAPVSNSAASNVKKNGAAKAQANGSHETGKGSVGLSQTAPAAAVAGSAALVARDESLHLTILEEKSLLGRLGEELAQVGRDSQLTWPEFKRNPAGFLKRTATGYGQAAWAAVSRPAVAMALLTAVVAVGVTMGAIFLLERRQSGGPGMSKGSTIALGIGAVLLLGGLLVAWLKRERPEAVGGAAGLGGTRVAESGSSNNDLVAVVASLLVVVLALAGVYFGGNLTKRASDVAKNEELELMQMVEPEIPKEEEKPVKEGNAGNNKGKGGGSLVKPAKPQGGGGGGDEKADKPVSKGEPPPMSQEPQIVVPKPQPPPPRPVLLPVMPTLKGDAALSRTPRNMQFGDQDSNATEISRGKGTGEGFGGGDGTGAGKGSGAGLGPGRGENTGGGDGKYGGGGPGGGGGGKPPAPEIDYNRPFSAKEVTRKAVITGKPEPPYTEEGRKNATVGTVVVRVLLGSNGAVQQAAAVTRLPYGLTESAVAAARRIRFTPAQKDGRNVSQWVQVEYSFNLY